MYKKRKIGLLLNFSCGFPVNSDVKVLDHALGTEKLFLHFSVFKHFFAGSKSAGSTVQISHAGNLQP